MMIYLIEFNQLAGIKISCGSLYQINQMKMNPIVKQQSCVVTRSKIRIGILPKNNPSILFIEIGKKLQLTIGTNHLMNSGQYL